MPVSCSFPGMGWGRQKLRSKYKKGCAMVKKKTKTPRTPEEAERLAISAAMELATQQILDGTASNSMIIHFLKLGSSRERLEQARLEADTTLARAKVSALESAARTEELVQEALAAFKVYSGDSDAEL
jgi:hypothetical protein